MTDHQKMYQEKLTTPDKIAQQVQSGWLLGMDTATSQTPAIMTAIAEHIRNSDITGVKVQALLDAYPFELSGGMGQRVGILSALLMQPRILLADEPTSALDNVTQVQVVRELLALCKENGTALILVTHHMGVAYYMADELLVMQDGRVVETGTREKIFHAPTSAYTKALIAAVPHIGGGNNVA